MLLLLLAAFTWINKRYTTILPLQEQLSQPVLEVVEAGTFVPARAQGSVGSNLRHYSMRWNPATAYSLPIRTELPVLPAKYSVLLTIELWPEKDLLTAPNDVMQELMQGAFDQQIDQLCARIAAQQNTYYLRLNPEMEVPAKVYPWQNQAPKSFSNAYRYFAQRCRKLAPQAKLVWGPAGYPGDLEFWPGADVVDLVSITLGSASEAQAPAYPGGSTGPDALLRKLHRVAIVEKPVVILGSPAVPRKSFQREWLVAAARDMRAHQQWMAQSAHSARALRRSIQSKAADTPPVLGVLDRNHLLVDQPAVRVEHLFTDWLQIMNGGLQKDLQGVFSRNHDVILTVEPWNGPDKPRDPNVLANILRGHYDKQLKTLYGLLANTRHTIYLRWAHEMEIPITRYAWQSQNPLTYIKAYRYFALFNQENNADIRLVWGPAGDRGSLDFWPGDDVVDYISIAIYGLPDKNITDHTQQETFRDIFLRKTCRMEFVHKPIFITEFGVKGPDDFQQQWLQGAAQTLREHPEVVGACYFNWQDLPEAWGNIQAPDWSITPAAFNKFAAMLQATPPPADRAQSLAKAN
ncbi:hypothetical protein [Hymenobacter sp. DG25B]|uniref:hypothetical protein n=1 Tax=Hymenobacter sp. DG25B TaxID=1385664 RepID=UPI0012DFFDF5|nr:hypothetical protein [Hymenobacter sp. DG25B]